MQKKQTASRKSCLPCKKADNCTGLFSPVNYCYAERYVRKPSCDFFFFFFFFFCGGGGGGVVGGGGGEVLSLCRFRPSLLHC